jgi:hypothetical protein
MFSKIEMTLAALLVFGSVSMVLAAGDNRTTRHSRVVRSAPPPTTFENRNAATNHAVKPFTAEEKAWFDRASRVF